MNGDMAIIRGRGVGSMTRMTRDDVLRVVGEARERWVRPYLYGVNLSGANLRGVNLQVADLRDANLQSVDLHDADLYDADLRDSYLYGADLRGVDLTGANLRAADLDGANLCGADLAGANLSDARWDGLTIDGLHPHRILLTPTPDGWHLTIGCWSGTPGELRSLIAQDDGWPEAEGEEITRRRPLLEAALHVVDAHIAARHHVIDDLKERWQE